MGIKDLKEEYRAVRAEFAPQDTLFRSLTLSAFCLTAIALDRSDIFNVSAIVPVDSAIMGRGERPDDDEFKSRLERFLNES